MTPEDFKMMILIKLELLRGCCNVKSIKKADMEKSIEEFIKKVKEIKIEVKDV